MEKFEDSVYEQKLEEIFRRFPSVQNVGFGLAYKPGIERMREFARRLGNPQDKYKCIHVAGTNGKGSVSNMLAAVIGRSGWKTGLYTSPHLLDFRERMRVLGEGCAQAALPERAFVLDFILRYEALFDELDLSFFEITTGMAFAWFAQQKVDVAVVEVGLGGRLDSTNIVSPCLCVVTGIGMDHCEFLGRTLEEIAGEKAGIFKKGVMAVVGERVPETAAVFEKKGEECGIMPIFANEREPWLWAQSGEMLGKMDLRGAYQKANLRTVLTALEVLRTLPDFVDVADESVVRGAIEETARIMNFHGRWEKLAEAPEVICDIGHNEQALKVNFGMLERMMEGGRYSSLVLVYGVMADKDVDAIIPLMPKGAKYVFTTPMCKRAMPAEEILRRFEAFESEGGRRSETMVCNSVKDAVEQAFELCDRKGLIYIGGSTFVVSEALPLFNKQNL